MAALPKPSFALSHSKAQAPVATTPAAVASAANLAAATVTGGQPMAMRQHQPKLGDLVKVLGVKSLASHRCLTVRYSKLGQGTADGPRDVSWELGVINGIEPLAFQLSSKCEPKLKLHVCLIQLSNCVYLR